VGAVLKGLYNLCFVAVWLQGNWYYAISIFTSNVVLALALDHFLSRTLGKRPFASTPVRYAVILPLIALSSWYCFSGIVSHKAAQHFGQENAEIYAHGAEIAREIHSLGATSYLELEDGEIAFATSMPSVSGFGLALDPEAANAKKEGHFLNLMEGRGIHFIVAGGLYQYVLNVSLADPSPAFNGMKASEFTGYSIQPVLEDRAANVTIYRIVKRDKKPADAPIILSGLNHGKTS
jgi:hypothetical protein